MKKSKMTLHPDFRIGEISERLFGAFLEPIGSMVNGSMYNPKHPAADDQGFRKDFYEALKKTGLPAVRLPGGNFVSGWQWKDSIGSMEQRKTHLDTAWFQVIPNDVGHDEYLQWAEKAGAEGVSLQCEVSCDRYDIPQYAIDDMNQYGGFTDVQTIQAAAALNEEEGELNVFVINGDSEETQELELDVRGFDGWQFMEHVEMSAEKPTDADTYEHPDAILPRVNGGTMPEGGFVKAILEKESWNVLRFRKLR